MKDFTLQTRRAFLANCGIATATATMPHFLARTAEAVGAENGWEAGSAAALPGFKDDHILVVVQLSGGNDGLNTVAPFADDAYRRARPKLALAEGAQLRIDDRTALHRALAGVRGLYDDGRVAIVEGVGYPNPDRSHFRSMEIWHTAVDSNRSSSTGWIGRYFDNCCSGAAPATSGVFIGGELPEAFAGKSGKGVAFQNPDVFGYVAGDKGDDTMSYREINAKEPAPNATLDFLRHVTDNANISTDRIQQIARSTKTKEKYPQDGFAQGLSVIARMIAGGLGSRIYYASLGGFDTHANQAGAHERLLRTYSEGVTAFYRDLKAMGESRRVVIMSFSEFGRRVGENASGGTDHGTAAPMFVIGDPVKGGLYGKRPSLEDLDRGDLKHTTDFRGVYATMLDRWFGVKPDVVLGRDFDRLDFLSA